MGQIDTEGLLSELNYLERRIGRTTLPNPYISFLKNVLPYLH